MKTGQLPTPIRILLVDDSAVVLESLRRVLSLEEDMLVVGDASDGWAAVEQTRRRQPDVIIMDLRLQGVQGIEATRIISCEFPEAKVIGLSNSDDPRIVDRLRRAGASAFVLKGGDAQELVQEIRKCATASLPATPPIISCMSLDN